MSTRRPRILVVAYYFPPVAGGGVSRTLKALAALDAAGLDAVVLTVDDAAWAHDPGLHERVPPRTRVVRVPNPDWGRIAARGPVASAAGTPGGRGLLRRWLVPDLHVGWSLLAAPVAAGLAAAGAVDLAYVSAPPYSAFAAGLAAGAAGVPWIADFRDGWTCCPTRADLPPRRVAFERRLEDLVLRRADRVLFASEGPRARCLGRLSDLAVRSDVMLSGYDPGEFAAARRVRPPAGRLELVHAGTVLTNHREAALDALLGALAALRRETSDLAARVRLRLLGGEDALAGRLRAAGLDDVVRVEPGVPRARLGQEIARAHGAVALAPGGARGPEPIPGKLFDAAGARRPLLAISAPGPLPALVRRAGLGVAVAPEDGTGLRAQLRLAMERAACGALAWPLAPEGVAGLAAPVRMQRLVDICRELLAARELPCPSPSAS
jgi:glycosyltransferase involved in cell wall biosynthesis